MKRWQYFVMLWAAWGLGAFTAWSVTRVVRGNAPAALVCARGCEIDVAPVPGERLRALCWCDTRGEGVR